jgi:hypothetical protein
MSNNKSNLGNLNTYSAPLSRILWIGFLTGFLLNLTGWLGNNFLLGSMWNEVGDQLSNVAWRDNIWRDIFSFIPDFIYGFAIAWLCNYFNANSSVTISNWIKVGVLISVVGGLTTYFAVANSGFIPWKLAFASFILVLITKLPLSILAGKMLVKGKG